MVDAPRYPQHLRLCPAPPICLCKIGEALVCFAPLVTLKCPLHNPNTLETAWACFPLEVGRVIPQKNTVIVCIEVCVEKGRREGLMIGALGSSKNERLEVGVPVLD